MKSPAEFAEALKRADWEAAGRLMDEETEYSLCNCAGPV